MSVPAEQPPSQPKPKCRWLWLALAAVVGVVVGAVFMFIVIDGATRHYALANPTWTDLGHGAGVYLTSPGFGGAAAVFAAILAYLAANVRAEVDRKAALADRADDRWWEMHERVWSSGGNLGDDAVKLAADALEAQAEGDELRVNFMLALLDRLDPKDEEW